MDANKFIKANEIKERIVNLRMLKSYLSQLLKKEMFSVTTEICFGEYKASIPAYIYPNIEQGHGQKQEDREYVLNAIDKRIEELEQEFQNL